jgi:hypothetical protein
MPANKPLLILPKPTKLDRQGLNGGGSQIRFPDNKRQKKRLNSKFQNLKNTFQELKTELREDLNGIEPEHVIVFETVGSIDDFYKAVKDIPGIEWLFEFDAEEIAANEDFYKEETSETSESSVLSRKLYLVMSNKQGLKELLSLWSTYCQDESTKFPTGQAKWKHLFRQLNDLRLWGVKDRLESTGLDLDWQERVSEGKETVKVEIELWFRKDEVQRVESEALVAASILKASGRVISATVIPSIRYHAILAELPIASVETLIKSNAAIQLAKSEPVMFFRPTGQSVIRFEKDSEFEADSGLTIEAREIAQEPFVALLDGLPLANHEWIKDCITVDDPEGLSSTMSIKDRKHGTAMASLVINGDDDKCSDQLKRRIYSRPILHPYPFLSETYEKIPEDRLSVDVIHQAIIRMLKGTGTEEPTAPRVKVINLSVAEKYRPFVNHISPLARLLDWLSSEFNILFIISSGNCNSSFLSETPDLEKKLTNKDLCQKAALKAITYDTSTRRLLSPSESLNSLTVGASYADNSTFTSGGEQFELFNSNDLCAPFSSFGLGIKNSIKPDFMAPGGRLLYRKHIAKTDHYDAIPSSRAPGQKVATPSAVAGSTKSFIHTQGTSNSAALTTRLAAKILENLNEFNSGGSNKIPEEYWAVLTKTLLAHGTSWGKAKEIFRSVSPIHPLTDKSGVRLKNWITRFIGYGSIDETRSLICEDHRATAFGFGKLEAEKANLFEFPLPPSLIGANTEKRLTVTLSWLTPVNPLNRNYRKAHLWFTQKGSSTDDPMLVSRRDVEWQTVKRGTLQHEIFQGNQVSVFGSGEKLKIIVNCRVEGGKFDEPIPYALAVSIESADKIVTTIYNEVKAQIEVRTKVNTVRV